MRNMRFMRNVLSCSVTSPILKPQSHIGASLVRQAFSLLEVGRVNKGIAMSLILILVSPSLYAKPKVIQIVENGITGILNKQLNKLTDGFDLVQDQLDVEKRIESLTEESMNNLNSKISGSYDMGKLVNDVKEQARRRWSPSDIFKDSGNQEYRKLQHQHERKYDFKQFQSIDSDPKDEIIVAAYDEHEAIQKNAIVSAQYTTLKLNENIANIERLMHEIDSAENQKAATDLNSRIQAQVALELVELKRLSALQLQALGAMTQESLLEQQSSAQFNRWA